MLYPLRESQNKIHKSKIFLCACIFKVFLGSVWLGLHCEDIVLLLSVWLANVVYPYAVMLKWTVIGVGVLELFEPGGVHVVYVLMGVLRSVLAGIIIIVVLSLRNSIIKTRQK